MPRILLGLALALVLTACSHPPSPTTPGRAAASGNTDARPDLPRCELQAAGIDGAVTGQAALLRLAIISYTVLRLSKGWSR